MLQISAMDVWFYCHFLIQLKIVFKLELFIKCYFWKWLHIKPQYLNRKKTDPLSSGCVWPIQTIATIHYQSVKSNLFKSSNSSVVTRNKEGFNYLSLLNVLDRSKQLQQIITKVSIRIYSNLQKHLLWQVTQRALIV